MNTQKYQKRYQRKKDYNFQLAKSLEERVRTEESYIKKKIYEIPECVELLKQRDNFMKTFGEMEAIKFNKIMDNFTKKILKVFRSNITKEDRKKIVEDYKNRGIGIDELKELYKFQQDPLYWAL